MSAWKPLTPMPRMAHLRLRQAGFIACDRDVAIEILDICSSSKLNIFYVAKQLDASERSESLSKAAFRCIYPSSYYNLSEIYAEAAQRLREGSYP